MIESNFNSVIDISSIIWSKDDFEANRSNYYDLIAGVSSLLERLNINKQKVLLRNELISQMIEGFPCNKLPNKFYDFEKIVYTFLANSGSNCISYKDIDNNIVSAPNLVKTHFKDETQIEISYLISKIHSEHESVSKYFTFNYLWNGEDKLKTETDDKTNIYETIVVDKDNELDDFFAKFKLFFKHKSPKHDCSEHKNREAWKNNNNNSNFKSQLSCFCDKKKGIVQKIFDKRCRKCFGDMYYGYDEIHNVYVVFRITLNNEFHAYDEYDIERVPKEVKQHFNINRY